MTTTTTISRALLMGLAACLAGPAAFAQSCTGTTDLSGSYMFLAHRPMTSEPGPPPPSTTNVEQKFSTTPVGRLLRGAAGTGPFAVSGRVLADGQGSLFAGDADAQYLTVRVGSYSVGADCSLSVTMRDGFLPDDPFGIGGPKSIAFTGVLEARGGEASLVQSSSGYHTTVTLSRAFLANACTRATFSGPYGLSVAGIEIVPGEGDAAPTFKPYSVVARVVSDGNGVLFADEPALASKVAALQFTGTYAVLADCTGTIQLVSGDGKTKRNLAMVIVQPNAAQSLPTFGTTQTRPVLRLVAADANLVATGMGREATGRF